MLYCVLQILLARLKLKQACTKCSIGELHLFLCRGQQLLLRTRCGSLGMLLGPVCIKELLSGNEHDQILRWCQVAL